MNTSIPHANKSQIQSLQELSLGKTEQDVREDLMNNRSGNKSAIAFFVATVLKALLP